MRMTKKKETIIGEFLGPDYKSDAMYVDVRPLYSSYSDAEFPTLINKRNHVVAIAPYGNFTIRCGHEPKTGSKMIFLAWFIKAPLKYKGGLMMLANDNTREKAIKLLVDSLNNPNGSYS